MTRTVRMLRVLAFALALIALAAPNLASAQPMQPAQPPDFAQFGYPQLIASALVLPDQAVTLSIGPQTVTIRPGTFDNPVAFDLLVNDPAAWQPMVQGRTVRAAFAFRVRDSTTNARVGMFKQPVLYSYTGADAKSDDAILNTSAATPAVVTPNAVPITFDAGKVNHPFGGAGVGWLVVSK